MANSSMLALRAGNPPSSSSRANTDVLRPPHRHPGDTAGAARGDPNPCLLPLHAALAPRGGGDAALAGLLRDARRIRTGARLSRAGGGAERVGVGEGGGDGAVRGEVGWWQQVLRRDAMPGARVEMFAADEAPGVRRVAHVDADGPRGPGERAAAGGDRLKQREVVARVAGVGE